jgi:hypothetical protein
MKSTVKEPEKRAGVDYFVAIITSERTLKQYLDFLRIKGEGKSEYIAEDEETTISINKQKYIKIISDDDRDIFFCGGLIKFLIKDYSEFVPKLYTLSQYNKKYPEKSINMLSKNATNTALEEIENALCEKGKKKILEQDS